jgi:hypothetical protein
MSTKPRHWTRRNAAAAAMSMLGRININKINDEWLLISTLMASYSWAAVDYCLLSGSG